MFKPTILVAAMLVGGASSAGADPIRFTFSGTLGASASRQEWNGTSWVFVGLPAVDSPFTGTAFFDADDPNHYDFGFSIDIPGTTGFVTGGGYHEPFICVGCPTQAFLTPTEMYLQLSAPAPNAGGGGPYGSTMVGWPATTMSLNFLSNTGSFAYYGDGSLSLNVTVSGEINSIQQVPDTTSSVWLALPSAL